MAVLQLPASWRWDALHQAATSRLYSAAAQARAGERVARYHTGARTAPWPKSATRFRLLRGHQAAITGKPVQSSAVSPCGM